MTIGRPRGNGRPAGAGVGGWGGPYHREVIADFLAKQAAAVPLATRIARLRESKATGIPIVHDRL